MNTVEELRKLNNELIEEIEEWKYQHQILLEECKAEVEKSKAKNVQLEGLVDELTERIDNLIAECEDLEGAEEQNKLLRKLLKEVL